MDINQKLLNTSTFFELVDYFQLNDESLNMFKFIPNGDILEYVECGSIIIDYTFNGSAFSLLVKTPSRSKEVELLSLSSSHHQALFMIEYAKQMVKHWLESINVTVYEFDACIGGGYWIPL